MKTSRRVTQNKENIAPSLSDPEMSMRDKRLHHAGMRSMLLYTTNVACFGRRPEMKAEEVYCGPAPAQHGQSKKKGFHACHSAPWNPMVDGRFILEKTLAEDQINSTVVLPGQNNRCDSQTERVVRETHRSPLRRVLRGETSPHKATKQMVRLLRSSYQSSIELVETGLGQLDVLSEAVEEVRRLDPLMTEGVSTEEAQAYLTALSNCQGSKNSLKRVSGVGGRNLTAHAEAIEPRYRQFPALSGEKTTPRRKARFIARKPLAKPASSLNHAREERKGIKRKLSDTLDYFKTMEEGTVVPPVSLFPREQRVEDQDRLTAPRPAKRPGRRALLV
jgi:hypothetical protein